MSMSSCLIYSFGFDQFISNHTIPHKHTKATDSCLMFMRAVWHVMCIVAQCDDAVYDLVDDDTLEWFYAIHFIGMKRNF